MERDRGNLKDKIFAIIDHNPLSARQIAEVLDIKPKSFEYYRLIQVISDMQGSEGNHNREMGIAIDRKSEGVVVGPNTYRLYRIDQEKELEEKGIIRSREYDIDLTSFAESCGYDMPSLLKRIVKRRLIDKF